jgi:hypothetical protein
MKKPKQFPTWYDPTYSGRHNSNLSQSISRLETAKTYKDLSTVMVLPTRGVIPAKVCNALWSLMTPMNGKFFRHIVEGKEVGQAYNEAVETILANSELSKWKYMLTVEEDNLPPPDGLLKLYENMDKYDAIGGLYFTKGDCGMPMIYGDVREMPKNFRPQIPIPNAIQECNGLGMGFTLFKISMLKKMTEKGIWPLFKTVQEFKYGEGASLGTQDLYFFGLAGREGYRFASDNRVLVGHLDQENGIVW